MSDPGITQLIMLASRLILGLADWRDVERFGLAALANGASEPELVALASVQSSSYDLKELVNAAVVASGGAMPSASIATRVVARDIAKDIVSSAVEPAAGARAIWKLARESPQSEPELGVFVGLASEWEDDEVNRAAYDADIVSAATDLVGRDFEIA